jgi:hypothetical protein
VSAAARRWLSAAFTLAVLVFVGVKLSQQWPEVSAALASATPNYYVLGLSCAAVLANYGVLIQVWRMVLKGFGFPIPYWDAARIWTISNLGKYIPGKVWALSAMAVMAEAKGVSPVVAAAAALYITLVNTVVGFVVVAATGADVLDFNRNISVMIVLLGLVTVSAPPLLPWLGARVGRLLGREIVIPRLSAAVIFSVALITAMSWYIYGLAFYLFAGGMLGTHMPGGEALYVAIFAGSYLIGFVALFAPGGSGVREAVMANGLKRAGFATGPAYLVVVASRLWLTVLEIVPALLFLGHGWATRRRD